jgi:Fic family protein
MTAPFLPPLSTLRAERFETTSIFKRLNATSRRLAELKGVASTIPNQSILINTLGFQEAKDSSAIENIITTHDELFRDDATEPTGSPQAKEVHRYRKALLTVVEQTASETIETVLAIKQALQSYKHRIRERHKFYSQDLINNLFTHPYTKIVFVERELRVSRITATRYLDALVEDGFLRKERVGRANFYINVALNDILTGERMTDGSSANA